MTTLAANSSEAAGRACRSVTSKLGAVNGADSSTTLGAESSANAGKSPAHTAAGSVTVLVGPTAVGKGTVVAALRAKVPQLWLSVSATTRSPRPGEVEGQHYYFVTPEKFDEMVKNDQILEWAVVHGLNKYGTPRQPVEKAMAAGLPVLLELDLAGARQLRKTLPQAKQVFLAPPSWEELKRRLIERGTESESEQKRRLETAKGELAAQGEFDYIVINDEVARATDELMSIMGLDSYTNNSSN